MLTHCPKIHLVPIHHDVPYVRGKLWQLSPPFHATLKSGLVCAAATTYRLMNLETGR